jgi:hypothetical protein
LLAGLGGACCALVVAGGAIVAGMVMRDAARAVVGALAEPEALLVFGAIVTATSRARLRDEFGGLVSGTSYITPFGLEKKTSLPRDVIEKAALRLKRAGLLEVLVDEQRGYESWRVSERALCAASE